MYKPDTTRYTPICRPQFGVRRLAGKDTLLVRSLLAVGQGGGAERPEDLSIDSFMQGSDGQLFEKMESYDEADKRLIRDKILEAFVAPDRFNKEVYTRFFSAWAGPRPAEPDAHRRQATGLVG